MAGEEPYFPKPTKRDATPGPYRAATEAVPAVPPRRVVVSRPESPASPAEERGRPKLSPDEIRALIAVETAQHMPWKSSARRSVVLVPIGFLGRLLYAVAGNDSLVVAVAIALLALVWIARPLFRRDGFA